MWEKKIVIMMFISLLAFSVSCKKSENDLPGEEAITIAQQASLPEGYRLPIPPLLEHKDSVNGLSIYKITVQQGQTEFFPGVPVTTYGYNGPLLGPTIRVSRGERIKISVTNRLREYTTVHWHGLLVPGEMDGGPHQVIPPDRTWSAEFTVNQPAATAWYHPHGLGATAIQVYRGLGGLFIIDDDISEKLNIPHNYGIDDIPLIVQDRRFSEEGVPLYVTNMRDIMTGMKGNTMLVNGVIEPYHEVTGSLYRFRILNASNARVYNFRFEKDTPFYQIASDAGLLEKPVKITGLVLSPGERAEVLVDFSGYDKGDSARLVSGYFTIMRFKVISSGGPTVPIPDRLVDVDYLNVSAAKRNRVFQLEGMGPMVSINGKKMNMDRIDEYMKLDDTEIWTITSTTENMGGGMMGRMHAAEDTVHNFHAHGLHFQVISRNGGSVPEYERGWKDTVHLDEGEEVKVITRFNYRGLFMYHCHILEHEDNGMMGQFLVK